VSRLDRKKMRVLSTTNTFRLTPSVAGTSTSRSSSVFISKAANGYQFKIGQRRTPGTHLFYAARNCSATLESPAWSLRHENRETSV
jgi:hypothetical protein